jgi:putative effector of murein hydrolase
LKILTVIVVGSIYTLITTVYAVSFVGKGLSPEAPAVKATKNVEKGGAAAALPYSQDTLTILVKSSIVMATVSIAATRTGNDYQTPLQTIFFMLSTLAAYVYAARLPSSFTKVVHPLVTSSSIALGLVYIMAELTGSTFMNVLATYKVGSMHWKSTGAGDILLYLLGPSVVSFANSMYSRRKLLKENLAVVITAMLVSGVGGAFGTAFFVRLLQIGGSGGGKLVRLSLVARNVTTALAMAITSILGGDISISASVVVLTGILGGTYGPALLDAMGVKDPIARGLGIGAAAQGIGVASLVSEPDAFPFAAISMVLTAICATTLVSIPAVKHELISIVTGS